MAQADTGQADIKPVTDDRQAEIIDLDAIPDASPDLVAPQTAAAQPSTADGGTQQQPPGILPAAGNQQAPPAEHVKQEEGKPEGPPKAEVKEESGTQVGLSIACHLMNIKIASMGPLQGEEDAHLHLQTGAEMMASSIVRTLVDGDARPVIIWIGV